MAWADVFAGIGEGAETGGRFYTWAKGQETERAERAEERKLRREALASGDRNAQLDRELRTMLEDLGRKHGIDVLNRTQAFTAEENAKGRTHQTSMQDRGFDHDLTVQSNQQTFTSRENAADRAVRNNLAREDRMSREMDAAADRALNAWGTRGRADMDRYSIDRNADVRLREGSPGGAQPDIRLPPEMGEPPAGAIDPRGILPQPKPRSSVLPAPRGASSAPARTPDTIAQELQDAMAEANTATGADKLRALERVRALRAELGGGGQ